MRYEIKRVIEQSKNVLYEAQQPYYSRYRNKKHNNLGWQENQNVFHNN